MTALLQDLPPASTRYPSRTPLDADHRKPRTSTFVGGAMEEFQEEAPTQPEVTETLAEALERWRNEPEIARPRVNTKNLETA